jgi:hypothetical protein
MVAAVKETAMVSRTAAFVLLLLLRAMPAVAGVVTQLIAGDGLGRIALAGDGNLYLSSFLTHEVLEVTPAGQVSVVLDATANGSGFVLGHPNRLVVGGDGSVYVVGSSSINVLRLAPDGTVTQLIDATGDGAGHPLPSPLGLAVDAASNVFVSDPSENSVFRITAAGLVSRIIDASGDGAGNVLDQPTDVAVDAAGNVFVAGEVSHNVFRITPGGTITEIIDGTGDGTHALTVAVALAVDDAGNAYVSGSSNVFKITPGGVITEIIDGSGDGGEDLWIPESIDADQFGNVYVVGRGSENVFRIAPNGRVVRLMDEAGDGDGNTLLDALEVVVNPSGTEAFVSGSGSFNTPGRVFRIEPLCTPSPAPGCVAPTLPFKAKLSVRDNPVSARDKIVWKWLRGGAVDLADLGDPTTADHYSLCLYQEDGSPPTLTRELTAPAGSMCSGKPCWKALGLKGFRYKDPGRARAGLVKIVVRPGADGKAKAVVQVQGEHLSLPRLPLVLPTRVQLQGSHGACLEARYLEVGARRNDATGFLGRSGG